MVEFAAWCGCAIVGFGVSSGSRGVVLCLCFGLHEVVKTCLLMSRKAGLFTVGVREWVPFIVALGLPLIVLFPRMVFIDNYREYTRWNFAG